MLHMNNYTQIQEIERVKIFEYAKIGYGPSAIARAIGRDKSAISREIKRNSDAIGYLYPREAQVATDARKAKHQNLRKL